LAEGVQFPNFYRGMKTLKSAADAIAHTEQQLSKLLADSRFAEIEEHDVSLPFDASEEQARFIELHRRLSQEEQKSEKLERQLRDSVDSRDAAVRKAARLQRVSEKLRKLILQNFRNQEQCKHRMELAEEFQRRLQVASDDQASLLKLSEPPSNFKMPIGANIEETPSLSEVRALKARFRQTKEENEKLRSKLEKSSQEKFAASQQRKENVQRTEQKLANKHTQLLGAVRRVHYLLEQNKHLQSEISKRDDYIAKIEQKLLEMSTEMNVITSPTRKENASSLNKRKEKKKQASEAQAVRTSTFRRTTKKGKLDAQIGTETESKENEEQRQRQEREHLALNSEQDVLQSLTTSSSKSEPEDLAIDLSSLSSSEDEHDDIEERWLRKIGVTSPF